MKARSLYLGLQCAQWNINHSSPVNTSLALHGLSVSADLWQWHFRVHQKRGVLLISLVNVKQGLVPMIPAVHQLWKYILSHLARGQRCSIIQYVVKLKTETQCEYLFVILESLLLFPVSDVGNKDWRPAWRGAVRRERRDRERGGIYMPLSIALIADAIQTNGSISHPFPRGRWLWGASKSKWISKAIFSIIY